MCIYSSRVKCIDSITNQQIIPTSGCVHLFFFTKLKRIIHICMYIKTTPCKYIYIYIYMCVCVCVRALLIYFMIMRHIYTGVYPPRYCVTIHRTYNILLLRWLLHKSRLNVFCLFILQNSHEHSTEWPSPMVYIGEHGGDWSCNYTPAY